MASSHPNQYKFDVFLSFRGEDTRHSFTDHLYTTLKRAAIHTFRDNDEIKRGHQLEPEIVKAIQSSRASIVVLSENYAKSRWCLEELSLILQQRRKFSHFVLPVFYHVDPSHVRHQQESFSIEANEGIEGSKWTEENVNRWKSALREVANLTGMVASGAETEFIAKIVDIVDNELDLKLLSIPAHLTGMETRAKEINSWLKDEHSNTHVIAICGMGGIGKTTLAQYVYNLNKHNFESGCFLEEVGKYFKETYGVIGLQNQLLTDLSGCKNKMISCVVEGTTKINKVLQMKKVLIVLDDIDEHEELGTLLGTNVIHTQSKIIVTTRLLDIHSWFDSISWRCHVHELTLLNDHESLEVLSCHAFGSKVPLKGFCDLAVKLARYCGGNPLALKVLGSSLFVNADDSRETNNIIEVWRSRLNILSSLKGDIDYKIQGVLQKSFDSLPLACYKELFLHIAVFFVGENEDYVVKILEHDLYAKVGIMTLINRCLLTVSSKKKLMMHQLLQDMGRTILHEESKDPAKHARVWCSNEAYRMLTKGHISETIEGLTLDMRKLKKGTKALAIKTCLLAKMNKLKLLQINYVKLNGCYKNFPELRWLCWHGCQLKRIPTYLLMSRYLVAIDMTNGNLQKFEPPMVLNSLKILNLKDCYKLVRIHRLCWLPNLETLILEDCINLTHICKTIEGLENLAQLNLTWCIKLWKASWNKKKLSLPKSLKYLYIDYCNLKYQNDVCYVRWALFGMSLRGNLFEFMPNNIDLKMLRVLNLTACKNLKSILCLPSTLEELYTYKCISLEKVTFQSTCFRLRKFGYTGCLKLSEVQGLFKLVAIKELDEAHLGHLKWIKEYSDHKVDLVGDEITKGKIWDIQMLQEFGIRSTYLQGIKDQSMMALEYTSAYNYLSLHVSLDPKKREIQGLHVSCLYKSLGSEDKDKWLFFTKIRNITKGVTWIYNPLVYCKPRVDEDVMWLSYWPIGNILDTGDEVNVSIVVEEGMIVSGCGASLVYMEHGEVVPEEKLGHKTMIMEEVIGGDLSKFEVTPGVFYLCRYDFLKSSIPDLIKKWSCDTIHYTGKFPLNQFCILIWLQILKLHIVIELQGWKKSYETQYFDASCMQLEPMNQELNRITLHRDTFYKKIFLGYFNSGSDIRKIKKAVSKLVGVNFVLYAISEKMMYVLGSVDSMAVETCVREFQNTVRVIYVDYNAKHQFENNFCIVAVRAIYFRIHGSK